VTRAKVRDMLPELSVTLKFAVKVPELPSVVTVHVKRHGEPRVPALTITCVHASCAAGPAFTVTARPAPLLIVLSLTMMLAASTLWSAITPLFPL
jgi:hypothetical protein